MNIPRRALFGRLNAALFRAIESATTFAKLRGNPYVELVHWVHQIWQASGNDLHRVVSHYGLDAAQLEKDITVALAELPNGASSINAFSHLIELAVERAWVYASLSMNDRSIRGAWLLAAALETPELRRALLGISAVFQKIPVMQWQRTFRWSLRSPARVKVPCRILSANLLAYPVKPVQRLTMAKEVKVLWKSTRRI